MNPVTEAAVPSRFNAIVVGSFSAIGIGLFGFLLLHYHLAVYGLVVFLAVPFVAGFVAKRLAGAGSNAFIAVMISIVIGLGVLVATGAEGWVCVLMAFPLLFLGIISGMALASWSSRRNYTSSNNAGLMVAIPLLIIGSGWLEKSVAPQYRLEVISTSIVLPETPEKLFDMLKGVDVVNAPRPFLMRIGLPVPTSCRLERGSVGAGRTCYFDHGYIKEEVVEWTPPTLMKMRVVENHVPGRHWLGFKDAIYTFTPNPDGTTTVIRTTSITTALYPAIYWRPLERMGVETEHRYIFDDLSRRLQRKQP